MDSDNTPADHVPRAVVYPLDTLKFRMQCETVKGGERGNQLIWHTALKMWRANGIVAFYRGLPMGLAGMFPYAAIDLGTFEYLKRTLIAREIKLHGGHEEDATPNNFTLALMGGFSGAFGASVVYPMNLLRTRLQSQGTASHPRTYTGIMDVTRQTLKGEGVRGLFKGLTPNLLKVVPAVSIVSIPFHSGYLLLLFGPFVGSVLADRETDICRLREHEGLAAASMNNHNIRCPSVHVQRTERYPNPITSYYVTK